MKTKVMYYVIYTLDLLKSNYNDTITQIKPSSIKYPLFKMTEDEVGDPEFFSKHRKYCGIITGGQLKQLLTEINYIIGTCETMGSITEIGWLPAICYETECIDYCDNIYVSPLIEKQAELSEFVDNLPEIQQKIAIKDIQDSYEALLNNLRNYEDSDDFNFVDIYNIDIEQLKFDFVGGKS